ncbi:trypsin-like peptidase domain-containing protein [Corynebacterium sp. H127]|uniref:trypsin-like peptidase domain-containing protein n=1 Tax=Corynebacterium sp. H127 TaxID=3133418 RepID=UPI0030B39FE0
MRSAVRLTARHSCASGVLSSPALIDASLRTYFGASAAQSLADLGTHVLTAAHFLRDAGEATHGIRVSSPIVHTSVAEWQVLPGTDIAVGRLQRAVHTTLLPIAPQTRLGAQVISCGFSGQGTLTAEQLVPRLVRSAVMCELPWILSKDLRTRARHGALLLPLGLQWARKGDSGGAVISEGKLIGLQSMVAMPLGIPIGVAGVNLLGPHLPALKAAMNR